MGKPHYSVISQRLTQRILTLRVKQYNLKGVVVQHIRKKDVVIYITEAYRLRGRFSFDKLLIVDIQEIVKTGDKTLEFSEDVVHRSVLHLN